MTVKIKNAMNEWSWLIGLDNYHPIAFSPFGDVVLLDQSNNLVLLDINMGELVHARGAGTSPEHAFPDHYSSGLIAIYEAAGLHLADGQCYGYKKQVVLGGSYEPSNVYIATRDEYVSFLGNFHNQIKDFPDGSKVELKVIK